MCSQSLRISQGGCEFGKVANLAMWFANLAKWFANLAKWFAKLAMWFAKLAMWFAKLAMRFAKLAMWFANLAMRNFAKLLKFYVRSEVRKCTVNVVSEFRNAN